MRQDCAFEDKMHRRCEAVGTVKWHGQWWCERHADYQEALWAGVFDDDNPALEGL
jgi:hypothetical protein